MILVNSSYVGGLGGARKLVSLTRYLKDQKLPHKIVTDSISAHKLSALGVKPDIIIPRTLSDSTSKTYRAVSKTLKSVKYEKMISFGWRTYVPADGVERGKPTVIIDGGWPEQISNSQGAFWKDVYKSISAYCLTNHFYDSRLDKLLPHADIINYDWIAQPFYNDEVAWYKKIGKERKHWRKSLPYYLPEHKFIFLNMNPECVDPRQGHYSGGWLTPEQLDECRGFVTRLIVELDDQAKDIPLTLVMHSYIAKQMEPVIKDCHNIRIFTFSNLSPEMHHIWRAGAHLVLLRATRNVSSAQVALSGLPMLRSICPKKGDYMGEHSTSIIANSMGITDNIDHESVPLGEEICGHLTSDARLNRAVKAQKIALDFHKKRDFSYLLSKLN